MVLVYTHFCFMYSFWFWVGDICLDKLNNVDLNLESIYIFLGLTQKRTLGLVRLWQTSMQIFQGENGDNCFGHNYIVSILKKTIYIYIYILSKKKKNYFVSNSKQRRTKKGGLCENNWQLIIIFHAKCGKKRCNPITTLFQV